MQAVEPEGVWPEAVRPGLDKVLVWRAWREAVAVVVQSLVALLVALEKVLVWREGREHAVLGRIIMELVLKSPGFVQIST